MLTDKEQSLVILGVKHGGYVAVEVLKAVSEELKLSYEQKNNFVGAFDNFLREQLKDKHILFKITENVEKIYAKLAEKNDTNLRKATENQETKKKQVQETKKKGE